MNKTDIETCLKLMNDSHIKSALMKSTEDAMEYGVSAYVPFFSPLKKVI